jgi:membrane-bound lytic murein transglycosylase A
MFFRIVGLSDNRQPTGAQEAPSEREAIGAQGIPLTPGRSIAVDNALHVYGTPFFIQADLPITDEKRSVNFGRLMIAQDTGSAMVGPARADIFWGAGNRARQVASHIHHPGDFAMLVPREIDPIAAGARIPLPPWKPQVPAEAEAGKRSAKSSVVVPSHPTQLKRSILDCKTCQTRGGWMMRSR